MFKTLLLTLALSFAAPVIACSVADCKTEVELKINLTKNGFSHLRNIMLTKFQAETSERTDYYFDIFLNGSYYLKKTVPPIKLRFQNDGDTVKWQTQKTISNLNDSLFSVKTTEAISMDLKKDQDLFDAIESYHKHLSKLDPYALTLAEKIQDSLKDLKIIKFTNTLCNACIQNAQYFSTHFNHKKRVKMKLKLSEFDQLNVQVGETNNRGIVTYEIEAEIKKSSNLHQTAELFKAWLIGQGFNPASDLNTSIPIDPTDLSEIALHQLNQF